MKLLILFGLIASSAACRIVTTKPTSTSTAASTSTPPTTRTPTFANTCTGANGNVLVTTLVSSKPATTGAVATDTLAYSGTDIITCYVITDSTASPNNAKFTRTSGALNSNSITFSVKSPSGQGINAKIDFYKKV